MKVNFDHGLVMAALSQQIPFPVSVEMVEMLVSHWALVFAEKLGFDRLVVEGDSEFIINSINGGIMESSPFGHILQDIKWLLAGFSNVSIIHIRREGNCVAHRLARRTASCHFLVQMKSFPHDIFDVYNQDLLLIE